MKAIIIEEERFVEILDLLRHQVKEKAQEYHFDDPIKNGIAKQATEDCGRLINYYLVRWMQSHGAKCIR